MHIAWLTILPPLVHIVAITTAGHFRSNTITVSTHGWDNLEGICVAFDGFEHTGNLDLDSEKTALWRELKRMVTQLGATVTENVTIDNTYGVVDSLAAVVT